MDEVCLMLGLWLLYFFTYFDTLDNIGLEIQDSTDCISSKMLMMCFI